MKKITLLICLVIILNAPISAYAQATATTPTVTIAAGSGAAVGGVYNQNGSKTGMMATALTLAVLSATGATVKLTEASIQAGKTVYQVINDKFAQWVGGTSAENLTPSEAEELQSRFKVITGGGGDPEDPDNNQNNGTNVSEDGKLWFSPGSLSMLKKFTDFLEGQDDGLLQYIPPVISDSQNIDLGGYQTVMLSNLRLQYGNYYTDFSVDHSVAVLQRHDGSYNKGFVLLSNESFVVSIFNESGSLVNTVNSSSYGSYYYYDYVSLNENTLIPDTPEKIGRRTTIATIINNITKYEPESAGNEGTSIDQDGIYVGEGWNNSLLDNPNNQSLVVDPGILPYINPSTDQQISIPDYLQLLIDQAQANATDQNQPINVPATDPATLEENPIEVPVIEQDPVIEPVPSEPADPIETPDNPVQNPEEEPTPEEAVELMKVDLTRIFPFCIPWDLYHLIAKFNADPVTPSLTIDWGNILGSIGIDYETTIDLHDYDGVAQVLRTMETVAFVIGLAVATRSIFLQS